MRRPPKTRLTPISLALVTASLTLSSAMAATDDMQNMDHSQMPGMDDGQRWK
ncbi:hypothetical protein [Pseudomonas sp. ANT_J28]|uniref:hypothetical protein n=1 Tax=Pseudomonas sp. ANT_J28 TaxID=2597352 RepID=UPI0015B3892C|nr:hypothetical protein [Pseudomonas sp. ANT_J28]